jgi:dethiobiotin synthetase
MNKPPVHAIAIVGIHTGIGKTIASAVIAEAMGADYWKPVQAGLEERDAVTVAQLLTNGAQRVHPEAVQLKMAASPHAAAAAEGVEIDYTKFVWPSTDKVLLVETAGGVLSPISATQTMADFAGHFELPVILIFQNYLGSINHTLTAIETLRSRGIKILGLVMNGAAEIDSESFIEQYAGVKIIGRVPHMAQLNDESILEAAAAIGPDLRRAIAEL